MIAEKKVGCDYEKYFLIIEYEIPFFKGEFEEYADLFEFMDVPGLNEKSDIICSNEDNKKNLEKKNSISNNFYFRQIFPLINMNIKFSLFIFSVENYEQSNVIEILNKYIDKDNKNYYYFMNEKERIKKQNSLQSFRESIFYLNKIDNVDYSF